MSKSSRRKGNRVESLIVSMHQDAGVVARKVPLSGAMPGYPGDVIVADHFRCEVKARKNGAGFAVIERWLDGNDMLFLKRDRQKPIVVMDWDTYVQFITLHGDRPDQP